MIKIQFHQMFPGSDPHAVEVIECHAGVEIGRDRLAVGEELVVDEMNGSRTYVVRLVGSDVVTEDKQGEQCHGNLDPIAPGAEVVAAAGVATAAADDDVPFAPGVVAGDEVVHDQTNDDEDDDAPLEQGDYNAFDDSD